MPKRYQLNIWWKLEIYHSIRWCNHSDPWNLLFIYLYLHCKWGTKLALSCMRVPHYTYSLKTLYHRWKTYKWGPDFTIQQTQVLPKCRSYTWWIHIERKYQNLWYKPLSFWSVPGRKMARECQCWPLNSRRTHTRIMSYYSLN